MPFCRLNPESRNIPSVMPVTAGAMAAPAIAVATCAIATVQKDCESRMNAEANTVHAPEIATRRCL